MPHVFDNIKLSLVDALRETLQPRGAADFCVGYFHLRGWGALAKWVEQFEGTEESCCRVLVGMHRPPEEAMREAQSAIRREQLLDKPTIVRLRREAAQRFKEQIEFGIPTAAAEAALRQLAGQLRTRQVRVKLFLRYPLHAKLYLVRRSDPITPLIGYVGSSNLTFAGLAGQGELNLDVVDQDVAEKLQQWFNDRWDDGYAFDISDELAELIETSWASEKLVAPYHVYLKMAYHLCEEAREGEREGRRYHAIRDYVAQNDPRVLLLTATPYNKQFTDLSNQLRLFVDEDQDLRVCPEQFFQWWATQGFQEADFITRFQASPRSLRAFEQSEFADDWRDLMRLFLVRRTRQFIILNYAQFDAERQRYFVPLQGQPYYFPVRRPKTLGFALDETDPRDRYAGLFRESVVQIIENLTLPRYGLANYLVDHADQRANADEKKILDNLNRAGRRLIGFCRTNLFKRLESSGFSFLLSVERHILRNLITLHALESGWPLPIGTQSAAMLDTLVSDADEEFAEEESEESTNDANEREFEWEISVNSREFADDLESYRARAAQVYQTYRGPFHHRFHWLEPKFFRPDLRQDLLDDAQALLQVLQEAGQWQPSRDAKLEALHRLLTKTHPRDKVLVFTQFADTALYLAQQLKARGVDGLAVVTSQSHHPTALARRFSPRSNGGLRNGETELRVLIATDVLAEGQNLQEAYVVVNFDLPWAIIRLIQRDGRVDRIGQEHGTILVYSFLPAEGVEAIIHLRSRLRHRLEQNQEVVGTDESFFGEEAAHKLRDLYTEKAGVLDDDEDEDVDFSSIALQVWNSASEKDRQAAQQLPPVVGAARPLAEEQKHAGEPSGVITYLRFPDGTDALVRVDEQGHLVSQSLTAAFRAAACAPDTPLRPRADHHHELVGKAVEWAVQEQVTPGGQLGSLRSIRRKVYERLKPFRERLQQQPTLFSGDLLKWLSPALDTLYRFPLRESARDALARQIRLGIADEGLAEMVVRFHEDDRLCHVTEEIPQPEPHIVCSLGLRTEPK